MPMRFAVPLRLSATVCVAVLATTCVAEAQRLSLDERSRVHDAVQSVVDATKVPSASVGVARGGRVVYTEAFGNAQLQRNVGAASSAGADMQISELTTKPVKARPGMAYPIGSISKQFTAACILLLQEQGKLRLDDPVAKWFPNFTRANEVTIHNLLTHTSGYSDYAPQDYTIPAWTKTVQPLEVVTQWATKPLDFEPGTKWQYSNTNFQIAAQIVEKASGQKYHDFLWANVITPLHLEGVLDLDTDRDKLDVQGYEQHALGPMRRATLEAPGWYYGDAQLAMPVATLLQWDESIVHRTLLKPQSYEELETSFRLKDGTDSGYGLGVDVRTYPGGKKFITHSGEVGGYVSNNVVDLTDDISYAALTNQEASSAASSITTAIRKQLLPNVAPAQRAARPTAAAGAVTTAAQDNAALATVRAVLTSLQDGKLDRTHFTADTDFYFSPETAEDYEASLAPLGDLRDLKQDTAELRGGMVFRSYTLTFQNGKAALTTYTEPDGKIEQFLIAPAQ
ncbi:serine hydrolase domain-containing protein [Terriglobus aquaticus]|uniref:Serine hydrolase domain-containing protein n=1 Tax=Terriglobus aquaticus TaxID=940139 RepID=A0ABW9KJ95_9BACT|nr:serine hydrolase domain-containing protein [Terriglobus aquaticus]